MATEHTFRPRGIGANWLACFVCGYSPLSNAQADMASFVDPLLVVSGPVGHFSHPVTIMFEELGCIAKLDYRRSEPNWVQVKLGACGEHEPNLDLLFFLASNANGTIQPKMIECCLPKPRKA